MRHVLMAAFAALSMAGCASSPDAPYLAPDPTAAATAKPMAAKPAARPKATGSPEDARRYMLRGTAAIEMAKSDADLALAEDEFRKATEIAPQMAEAWFNLGAVQVRLGRYDEAIESYRQYLALAPDADDAAKVRDELVKLEFRAEQQGRVQSREGIWVVESSASSAGASKYVMLHYSQDFAPYRLTVENGRLVLRAARHGDVWIDGGFLANGRHPGTLERVFVLETRGLSLVGTGRRGPYQYDTCGVPPEELNVSGEIDDANGKITLRYRESSYEVSQQYNLFLDPVACLGVNPTGAHEKTVVLRGPLPPGGIGADLSFYEDRVKVHRDLHPGFEAAAAGLKEDDIILAVDGERISGVGMPDFEILRRLRGQPGSEVELTVLHEDTKEPVTLRFRRGPLPDRNINSVDLPWLH
ncbi:MAG: tetratricopeptide repeat protein [Hydrogenophaga sp.]